MILKRISILNYKNLEHVELDFSQTDAKISINTELFQRALDNLYSNLLKYADQETTIQICYKRNEADILLSLSNHIRTEQGKTESTSIGLITCRRIIEYHKGCFTATRNNGCFDVTVSVPVQE